MYLVPLFSTYHRLYFDYCSHPVLGCISSNEKKRGGCRYGRAHTQSSAAFAVKEEGKIVRAVFPRSAVSCPLPLLCPGCSDLSSSHPATAAASSPTISRPLPLPRPGCSAIFSSRPADASSPLPPLSRPGAPSLSPLARLSASSLSPLLRSATSPLPPLSCTSAFPQPRIAAAAASSSLPRLLLLICRLYCAPVLLLGRPFALAHFSAPGPSCMFLSASNSLLFS